ncbi:tetratricopeptide repeat protein [Halpernia frigidisoli]|uniref:Uncharacterized protein n=1 Tax=Halpernia frigidisoli TaxID=1125876 RepID=A0A1I3FZA9_9FLAO|nr:hypothetical protein [Halpernia frigidisoli]SFI16539.1 hypothetical protein SAMN05443292_1731 [Halpernia frigidisoli]
MDNRNMWRNGTFILFFLFIHYSFCKNNLRKIHFGAPTVSVDSTSAIKYSKVENDNLKKFLKNYKDNHSELNKYAEVIAKNIFKAQNNAEKLDKINPESSALFLKAIKLSKETNDESFEIWTNLNYGKYLYCFSKYKDCYPYFMFCIKKINEDNEKNLIDPLDTFEKISFFLITSNENDLAISFLKKAEKIAERESKEMAKIQDNLGLAFLNKNNLIAAKSYFEKALQISEKFQDDIRKAKVLGNLAEIDFRNNDLENAVNKLQKDIYISKNLKSDKNTMFALIKLCKFYLKQNKVNEAEDAIIKAEFYAKSKPYFKNSLYEINEFMLQIARRQGNSEKELKARRTLEILQDSLKTLDGLDVIKAVGWQIGQKNLENKVEFEKNKYQQQFYLKIIAYLFAGIFLTALVILIITSRKKRKNQKITYERSLLALQMEKLISENKLNSKTKSLVSYRNYLLEKTGQIQELEAEVQKTRGLGNKKEDHKTKLDDLLKSHLLTAENWNNFKAAFENEKPVYSKYLETNFPNLTEANLRVIYLTQLELNNAEIARILGVTLYAVKKAKQRLRLKYEDQYEKFFEFYK